MKKVSIIDYGSGNIHSIQKACEKAADSLGFQVCVTSNYQDLENSSHIILPGVGAFEDCMNGIRKIPNLKDVLTEHVIKKQKFFLGVCVGMQLLADQGTEKGIHQGFGWIPGKVVAIEAKDDFKVPHMGWNDLQINQNSHLFSGINSGEDFYFVHSYCFDCENLANVLATVQYSSCITAAISYNNIYGVQFHPEKSQNAGLKLISNFLTIN